MTTPLKRQSTVRSPPRDADTLRSNLSDVPVDFQTGRLTRTIEIPFYEIQRRNLQFHGTWLGSWFTKKHGVRIFDIDLDEDSVLIENISNRPVEMGAFYICDEDRRDKLLFPHDLVLERGHFLKVLCSPGKNENLDAILEEADGRTTLWLWKTQKGGLSSRRVLSREGDCMYLYDEDGMMASAFAKTDDGAFKEYGPVNEDVEESTWRGLGLLLLFIRMMLLLVAGYCGIHTNLSSKTSSAHPMGVVGPLCGAILCDLLQRETLLFAHVHDFFGESLSIFADRLHAMTIYGILALFHGDYCGLFLLVMLLDLLACWCQMWASDCGDKEIKGLAGNFREKYPKVLTFICLASEIFLILLYVDHGHVQFRLYKGSQGFNDVLSSMFLKTPILTLPLVKEVLLLCFMVKQVFLLSQLWVCLACLATTTFPCVPDNVKTYLQQAMESRQKPNLEFLVNSESLQTLRHND